MDTDDINYKLMNMIRGTTLVTIARDLRTDDDSNPEYDRALVELATRALGLSHDEHGEYVTELILGDRR